MNTDMIGKIEKAKRYAEERKRFQFDQFHVTFHGNNNDHQVSFESGRFHCDCEFYIIHQRCSHSMALEQLLHQMLPEAPQPAEPTPA